MLITRFGGIKNDTPDKVTPPSYFRVMKNFNSDSITGFDQITYPEQTVYVGGVGYGGIEYRYLDSDNVKQLEKLAIFGGSLYKDMLGTPTQVISGLTEDQYSFTVFREELYMATAGQNVKVYNGVNNTVRDIGSPEAVVSTTSGSPNGTYYYAITFITAGGEEVTGAIGNTITTSLKRVDLTIPIGYAGTTSRKIYRTVDGGTTLKLVDTIADNTTLTYEDNSTDASLTTTISATNNPTPQCRYITTSYSRLVATVCDLYPTQVFTSETNIRVIDSATFLDISNMGDDNTGIVGGKKGYDKIYAWSELETYIVDLSGTVDRVLPLEVNVGLKSTYSPVSLPKDEGSESGVLFFSSDNTLRLATGNFANKANDSALDKIDAGNFGQNAQGTFLDLEDETLSKGIYYNYKYHLAFPERNLVVTYDIRTKTYHTEEELNVQSWVLYNKELYALTSDGYVEKWYEKSDYRGVYLGGLIESPSIFVNDKQKLMDTINFWFQNDRRIEAEVTVIIEDDYNNPVTGTISSEQGDYNRSDYNSADYLVPDSEDDYRALHIDRYGRWLKYFIKPISGRLRMRSIDLKFIEVKGEE